MLEFEYYLLGDVIVRSGSMNDRMYFIERGEVQVEMPGHTEVLSDGSFFGGNSCQLCMISFLGSFQFMSPPKI